MTPPVRSPFHVLPLCICCLFALGAFTSCEPEQASNSSAAAEQAADPNKLAYQRALLASQAPTFEGAGLLLRQIDLAKVTDADVASFVALSERFTKFTHEAGIPRRSGSSFRSVLSNVDISAITKSLLKNGVRPDLVAARAAELVAEGLSLKSQIDDWDHLSTRLSDRYGK